MGKSVLGKGLDALIPKKAAVISSKEFMILPLSLIKQAKNQPRQRMDAKELERLSRSIKDKGFIQPIVVRKLDDEAYEIVAGERRYQAAKIAGLIEAPVIIKELDEKGAFILAIVENLQRADLNPIEEAQAFKRLMDEFAFSLEDIAKFTGKDKTTVANSLRLLKLPEQIKEALRDGVITRTQARTILSVEKIQDQEKLFHQILKGGLTVRDIEEKAKPLSRAKKEVDPFAAEVEEKLQKLLGTKVKIYGKKGGRGKIVIEYYTFKDLERIMGRVK